jgi:hypothetical protein
VALAIRVPAAVRNHVVHQVGAGPAGIVPRVEIDHRESLLESDTADESPGIALSELVCEDDEGDAGRPAKRVHLRERLAARLPPRMPLTVIARSYDLGRPSHGSAHVAVEPHQKSGGVASLRVLHEPRVSLVKHPHLLFDVVHREQ